MNTTSYAKANCQTKPQQKMAKAVAQKIGKASKGSKRFPGSVRS